MTPASSFLDALKAAADDAARAEDDFRREVAERTKALERERSFAHRRLNFMRAVADAVASAEDEAVAVAAANAVVQAKLGWASDSEARSEVLTAFAPVAKIVFASLDPESGAPAPDVVAALRDFESWYATTRGSPFWVLFETYMPETPRVDF
ncbi:MAG: hypothetical protein JSR72_18565 [Proteobacteria bacterium]|nr:hypothetical protein [Pseudomonadota bacterium]